MPKRSQQVKVYLEPDQYEWLRQAAFDRRVSHSELVERALSDLARRLRREGRVGDRRSSSASIAG